MSIEECMFCYYEISANESISIPLLITDCYCIYNTHVECIEKWINVNSSCPICRKVIKINLPIHDVIETNKNKNRNSIKICILIIILILSITIIIYNDTC